MLMYGLLGQIHLNKLENELYMNATWVWIWGLPESHCLVSVQGPQPSSGCVLTLDSQVTMSKSLPTQDMQMWWASTAFCSPVLPPTGRPTECTTIAGKTFSPEEHFHQMHCTQSRCGLVTWYFYLQMAIPRE